MAQTMASQGVNPIAFAIISVIEELYFFLHLFPGGVPCWPSSPTGISNGRGNTAVHARLLISRGKKLRKSGT